jgi:uncharacterized protein
LDERLGVVAFDHEFHQDLSDLCAELCIQLGGRGPANTGTYNIMLGERRRVAAALIAVP